VAELMSKHVQIGDWVFEVKMLRALKIEEDGKPYSAIANCNINGDSMYIDGLLTQEGKNFTRDDFQNFNDLCYQIGLKQCSYHRYHNGESTTKNLNVIPPKNTNDTQADSLIHIVKETF